MGIYNHNDMRVDSEDPNLEEAAFDVNGNFLYNYMGKPFTGIIEIYDRTVLIGEYGYDDGYKWGIQKSYYPDGKLEEEWHIGTGGINGQWRRWDQSGNLIYNKIWVANQEQQ